MEINCTGARIFAWGGEEGAIQLGYGRSVAQARDTFSQPLYSTHYILLTLLKYILYLQPLHSMHYIPLIPIFCRTYYPYPFVHYICLNSVQHVLLTPLLCTLCCTFYTTDPCTLYAILYITYSIFRGCKDCSICVSRFMFYRLSPSYTQKDVIMQCSQCSVVSGGCRHIILSAPGLSHDALLYQPRIRTSE